MMRRHVSSMARAGLVVAALAAVAGCHGSAPCAAGTVLLSLTLDGAAATADSFDVALATPDRVRSGQRVSKSALMSGTLRLDFDGMSYPGGQAATLSVTAYQGSRQVGYGVSDALTLGPSCATAGVRVAAVDAAGLCDALGWCWMNPTPQGNTLYAVWSDGAEAWAVGAGGVILHQQGGVWSRVDSGTTSQLEGIAGSSGHDLWAVGEHGELRHFDGTQWAAVPSSTVNGLHHVVVTGDGHAWAVGDDDTILRYDGHAWATVYSRMPSLPTHRLVGVWATADDNVWAVGDGGLALHGGVAGFNGVRAASTINLAGVWSPGPNQGVWAVGSDLGSAPFHALVRYDGTVFVPQPTDGAELDAVWGTSGQDLWAVGPGTIVHSSGGAWTAQAGFGHLLGLGGSGANDVWSVGAGGVMARWDGGHWSSQIGAFTGDDVSGLWARAADDVWVVAPKHTAAHWDGHAWTLPPGFAGNATAVWGARADDVWIVGDHDGKLALGNSITHWNGHGWEPVANPAIHNLVAVTGVADDAWAAGHDGVILHHGAGGWTVDGPPGGVAADFYAAWESPEHELILVGEKGLVVTRGGDGTWARPSAATTSALRAVGGSGSGDVWAVGDSDTVLHRKNGQWTLTDAPPGVSTDWQALWARAADDVWLGGVQGSVMRWDGSAWSAVATTSREDVRSLGGSAYEVWAAGQLGSVLRLHQRLAAPTP